MSEALSIVQSSRRVIEHKLLTALEDDNTVAILASEDDLILLISALRHYGTDRAVSLASDYSRLRDAAFLGML